MFVTLGMLMLLVLSLLVLLGAGQRVLDRLHLTDGQALLAMGALFVGSLLPPLTVGRVSVGWGGAVVPLALCIWVLVKADTDKEVVRALVVSVVVGAVIFLLSRWLPADPAQMVIDPNWVWGLAAGAVSYIVSRSRRTAFVAAVLGVLIADIASGVLAMANGIDAPLRLGLGGVLDAVVISGILSVLLTEFVGELLERLTRTRRKEAH